MVTRDDIINILTQHETRAERLTAVTEYITANVLTVADRQKILDDLESYEQY
jgi:hypothetical protein